MNLIQKTKNKIKKKKSKDEEEKKRMQRGYKINNF